MRKGSRGLLRVLGVALLFSCLAFGDTFYSFGPDSSGVGRVFAGVPGAPAVTLGDGSLAFNGGVVAISDKFYAIANDPLGASFLESFTLGGPGTLTLVAPLGSGFNGGLAYDSAQGSLYAVSNNSDSDSFLNRIDLLGNVTALGALGSGFYGGLTFNAFTGLLYGFQGDSDGIQRVFASITPTVGPTVNQLSSLGDGSISFNGGVLFNPADGLFYAISNDLFGSTLNSFGLDSEGKPTNFQTVAPNFGAGYMNVGLTSAPAAVPEPSSLACLIAGLGLTASVIGARQRRERKRTARR